MIKKVFSKDIYGQKYWSTLENAGGEILNKTAKLIFRKGVVRC